MDYKNMGQQLIHAAQTDNSVKQLHSSGEILSALKKADPTKNTKYLQWIARMYTKGQFRIEDVSRIKYYLNNFVKYQFKIDAAHKDINKFKTVSELMDVIDPHLTKTTKNHWVMTKIHHHPEVDVFINEPDFKVLIPRTWEASCDLGRGTKWCTSQDEESDLYQDGESEYHYHEHSDQGPLYIIITPKRRFQMHYETEQFMDEKDAQVWYLTKILNIYQNFQDIKIF